MMHGPLTTSLIELELLLRLRISRRQPLRLAEQRVILDRLADARERAEALEEFQPLRRAEVVPLLRCYHGGKA